MALQRLHKERFEAFIKYGERLTTDLTDRARQVLTQERQERPAILAMQE